MVGDLAAGDCVLHCVISVQEYILVGDKALPRLGLVNILTPRELTDDIECVSVTMAGDFISLTVLGVEYNTSVSNHTFQSFLICFIKMGIKPKRNQPFQWVRQGYLPVVNSF
jgi:hypothetical protein